MFGILHVIMGWIVPPAPVPVWKPCPVVWWCLEKEPSGLRVRWGHESGTPMMGLVSSWEETRARWCPPCPSPAKKGSREHMERWWPPTRQEKRPQSETYLASTLTLVSQTRTVKSKSVVKVPSLVFYESSQSRLRHIQINTSLSNLIFWRSILTGAQAECWDTGQGFICDSRGKLTHQCGEDAWVLWGWQGGLRNSSVLSQQGHIYSSHRLESAPLLCSIWSRELLNFPKPGQAAFHDLRNIQNGNSKTIGTAVGQRLVCFLSRVGPALFRRYRKHLCSEKKRVQKESTASAHPFFAHSFCCIELVSVVGH